MVMGCPLESKLCEGEGGRGKRFSVREGRSKVVGSGYV